MGEVQAMIIARPVHQQSGLRPGPNRLTSALESLCNPEGMRFWMAVALIASLLAATTGLVFEFGGTKLSYAHALYLPVLAGALFFGPLGGCVTGLLAGLCVGPLMPLDVEAGTAQSSIGWIVRTGFFVGIGSLAGVICSALTRQVKSLREHGFHDVLTKLPNRSRLQEHLHAKMLECRSTSRPFALIKIRLLRHHTVASTLGHSHADRLLIEAARRLNEVLPEGASLYDVGGGSFATIVSGGFQEDVMETGRSMLQVLDQRLMVDAVPILPGGRIGIACYPQHGESSVALLRSSASALEQAAAARQPYAVYNDRKDSENRALSKLLPDLQVALATPGQLTLEFQPKVNLRSGKCVGAEALVRWNHPDLGMIPPSQFIPLAEDIGLMKPLTERVLGMALAQASVWKREGLEIPIAVNISIRDLEDPGFPTAVGDLLRFHGIRASQLELEITETAIPSMPQTIVGALDEMRGLGAKIALDDFGAGHCSLAHLRDLPADTLKLDRSFMQSLIFDRKTQLIVAAAVETAHALGFDVVAEGIENRAVFDRLREMHCDQGQGYFIARPLPAPDLRDWLADREKSHRKIMQAGSSGAP